MGWLKLVSLLLTLAHAFWRWAERRRLLEQAKKETVDAMVKKVDELSDAAKRAAAAIKLDDGSILVDPRNRYREEGGSGDPPPSV